MLNKGKINSMENKEYFLAQNINKIRKIFIFLLGLIFL